MQDLRSLREASGLSQFAAANRAGLDRTRLSHAENGHVRLAKEEEGTLRGVLVEAIRRRARQLESVLADAKEKVLHAGT
jgi:transcriptional regulator with XRE-family HTH domain